MANIMSDNTVILGAGFAGVSAAYHIGRRGGCPVVYERDADWGGLCGFFMLDGFRFDRFVHFTFAPDDYTRDLFEASSPTYSHPSVSGNYYHGHWLKHPAQNNLAPLATDEKVKIITDFIARPAAPADGFKNYDQWLRTQYGNYFTDNFPGVYTRKYWGLNASDMEAAWVAGRMHSPDLAQVLRGAFETQSENFYYTNFMKYPRHGGFRSLMDKCRAGVDIRFNRRAVRIEPAARRITFADGTAATYARLISSLPITEMVKMIADTPSDVRAAADALHWTCGYQVSLGFRRPDVAKYLWFYIYDADIPPARVYSPNLKSPDNVPAGCSSLQAEVFFDCRDKIPAADRILHDTTEKLKRICDFTDADIAVRDIRFEPYANITFAHGTRENREIVRNYLRSVGIETIGRFGTWDYLWSHQAFNTGRGV